MINSYFKMIGQKTVGGKMILVAVVDEKFLGEVPMIFEVQAFKMAPTIYTGTYPQIKVNIETLVDKTEELKGTGIAGILTQESWYNKDIQTEDQLGIGI